MSPLPWCTVRIVHDGVLQLWVSLCVSEVWFCGISRMCNDCRMTHSLLTHGTWPYPFMNKLSPPGLLMFFGISFLLYVAMYYIGKMLSHLRWGGKTATKSSRSFVYYCDGFFCRAIEARQRRLNLHWLVVLFYFYIYNKMFNL